MKPARTAGRERFGGFEGAQDEKENKKKFPMNAVTGKLLQPDDPLKHDPARAILDMMRDDLGMPVFYIAARNGHGADGGGEPRIRHASGVHMWLEQTHQTEVQSRA
jgi:hypothetical protein